MKARYTTKLFILSALLLLGNAGCTSNTLECKCAVDTATADTQKKPEEPSIQEERDAIYSLMAYAVVFKNWQSESTAKDDVRGYNIGSVLVDKNGNVVHWARNCVGYNINGTQHGEIRLMTNYLSTVLRRDEKTGKPLRNLEGYTIYTSLEPCAMCSGMMVLQSVGRTVYGQTDPGYGKALERLQVDSSLFGKGYKPYPRPVVSVKATNEYCQKLDCYYMEQLKKDPSASITDWLRSKDARDIYQKANDAFISFKPVNKENEIICKKAKQFLEDKVPSVPEVDRREVK